MTNGDMRYGRCGACGGGEVYRGEYVAQAGLRQSGTGKLGAKQPVFDAYVCAACGNTQLHMQLDAKMSSHIRHKLDWIPPQQSMG
ncbi:hypothetical protein DB35_02125 [Streptomyces abyssalis]|uniref:Uncharacterized protein n=1 Tax=Streptomyces abyssalis TaxID=933944 RepID=A0A1E7JPD8_9ACTN|nr:hypothetical protein [Streptomyces abyssalis]OEU90141.1 hypothetical protein AN215_11275 [Streptomyces abyssalis]OEU94874.1 hypothetical protein DB35_02125 [Streptomyces abyssalis]